MPESQSPDARAAWWRSSWTIVAASCVAAILFRAFFYLAWEESYFDSDQAIVGLMAKHLVEGRAFPLYFYGQEYMLGVEAWLAAPFIAIFGASVASLRTALIAINLTIGVLLVRLLITQAGLKPWLALLAATPFVLAPVVTSAHLVEAMGGNIEPFLWVLVLWLLRDRPLAFGLCLGVAFLNREFSIYAAPAVALVQVVEHRGVSRRLIQYWLLVGVAFLVTTNIVALLKPLADLKGPGTAGAPLPMAGTDAFTLLANRVQWTAADSPVARLVSFVVSDFPIYVGLKRFAPVVVAINTEVRVGWDALRLPMAVAALVALVVLVAHLWKTRREPQQQWAFPTYLILVGLMALVAYPVARRPSVYTFRYGLLALLLPIGLTALMLQAWRPALLRRLVAASLLVFAACSAIDHARVLHGAWTRPMPQPLRTLATALQQRHAQRVYADYWRAYSITFLTGETVKVASSDLQRIREYADLASLPNADGTRPPAIVLQREPCPGDPVAGWYFCEQPSTAPR